MEREAIAERLREQQRALQALGVRHATLFGSRARGDARQDSDIDIAIEIDPRARIGVWGYAEIVRAMEALFPLPVDVSNIGAQRAHVRPSAERDAIYAF